MKKRRFVSMLTAAVLTVTGYWPSSVLTASAEPYSGAAQLGRADIAYSDKNSDGIVDDSDKTSIGQTFPVTQLGLNLQLNYKGFGFYALATSSLGQTVMCTNAYFTNNGDNAYSVLALDRYHPVNNPGGSQPLRLKNVELSYTFGLGKKKPVNYKLFVRGANLLVISSVKDLDPECLNAGVSTYPFFRTVTGGLSLTF